MSKSLVAYFSASGSTRRLAQRLAKVAGADLFEIVPERLYTAADLDWTDRNSRSTRERDPKCRPAVASTCDNMDDYDTVYVGFPIWWYVAPPPSSTPSWRPTTFRASTWCPSPPPAEAAWAQPSRPSSHLPPVRLLLPATF